MDGGRRNMMSKTAFMVCGTALFVGLLTGTANATPAANGGCPTAYTPATYVGILATPEVQEAFADGIYDAQHITDAFSALNKNGDELICWKSVGTDDNTHFRVYYAGRYTDNNAGPKK
jgi:hypothetical protein